MLKAYAFLLAGVLAWSPAPAQSPALPGHFSSGRLALRADSTRIDASDIRVTADRISFLVPGAPGLPPISTDLPAGEVSYLEVRTGDHGGKGALIGGAVGLVAALAFLTASTGHVSTTADIFTLGIHESHMNTALAILVGCTGAGYLVGSSSGEYVPIREHGEWTGTAGSHSGLSRPPTQPLRLAVHRSF
jgi:hypothetical protein